MPLGCVGPISFSMTESSSVYLGSLELYERILSLLTAHQVTEYTAIEHSVTRTSEESASERGDSLRMGFSHTAFSLSLSLSLSVLIVF